MIKKTILSFIVLASLTDLSVAQGDGPRTMLFVPKNMNLITPAYLWLSSNYNFAQNILIDGADIRSSVIPVTYIRYFGIKGHFAQVWATPIWGNLKGSISQNGTEIDVPNNSGFADPYVAMRLGIIGAPALALKDFAQYKQTFQLYALLGIYIPIGKYNQSSPVNLGTNRWGIRVAAPMVLPFGPNPARFYFLEMTPSLVFYSKNNAPYNATGRTQAPLLILENHLTHNFTKKFWGGVDLRFQQGGQTTTDEEKDDNQISQIGGGLVAGYQILAPLGMSLGYDGVLISQSSKGQMWRFRMTMMF